MQYYNDWNEVVQNVKMLPKVQRVVVAGAHDAHSLAAVHNAYKQGIILPILVGNKPLIEGILAKLEFVIDQSCIYHEPDNDKAAALAVSLIRSGSGDILMKGMMDTKQLLAAVVQKEIGLGTGRLMSHISFQKIPRYHKMLITTDGGMVLYPSLEQKADIIRNAVGLLVSLGYEQPKVAVVAGVEKVNPKMPETVDAAELKAMNLRGEISQCVVEGPISLDLALVAEQAKIKNYTSNVAGDADILVFPNLCTSNCVGKAFVEMAGAQMAGLILGAQVPIIVTSRGSSSEEKYLALTLAAAFSGKEASR